MPESVSSNVTGYLNENPIYNVNWMPVAINTAQSTSMPIGSLLEVTTAGIGATPGPSGDLGSGTPYTVPMVDLTVHGTAGDDTLFAGVYMGASSIGTVTPIAPNKAGGNSPAFVGMCGWHGFMQVLCDNTTTIGHCLVISTSTDGCARDSGGTTSVIGTTIGTALQAVTVSSTPLLVWAFVKPVA